MLLKNSTKNKVVKLIGKAGLLRARDLDAHGVPREYLSRLCDEGLVQRIGRGLYALAAAEPTEGRSYAEAAKRFPRGVICLLSALQYHQLTTQMPSQIWVAIDPKARSPKDSGLPLKLVRFSGDALKQGVQEKRIENVSVRIYCPAKTVADCFKYRNKIGLDVVLEALRDCWRRRLCTMDELWRYAKICRVTNVMKPYLEMLLLS